MTRLSSSVLIDSDGRRWCGPRVLIADSFFERLRGLLGRESMLVHEGLLLEPCARVHTFGMREPIDLVFIDQIGLVMKICACVFPWRVRGVNGAAGVIELAAGTAARLNMVPGVIVRLI